MYFRIVETSQVDGKTRITVEADDPAIKIILQFFEASDEFAWAFRYRAEADIKSRKREKDRIKSEPERKAHRAQILSLWRSMKGMRPSAKVHRIQERMRLAGRNYRYCDVEAIVSIAIQDEKRSGALRGSPSLRRRGVEIPKARRGIVSLGAATLRRAALSKA